MSRPVVDVRPARLDDAAELAANLRDQDRDELDACGHTDHERVIRLSINRSLQAWTARIDGELACIFGVAPLASVLDPRGVPWMLGPPLVPRHRRILARAAPGYIAQMLEAYPHLVNQVHAKNTVAVHWLAKMGFVLQPPTPIAPHGELFHLFEMKRRV
jgi:hypothetical protein